MALINGIPKRIMRDEFFPGTPIVVEGTAKQNPDAEVDLDQIGGDEFAVDHDAGCHKHRASPFAHRLVSEVAYLRVLERSPTAEQHATAPDFLVTGKRLVKEIEQVVVQRHAAFQEIDVSQQP